MSPSPALPTHERLAALIATLESGLLERRTAVRLALLAALAGEHVLLIGPPGTAKSELARRLHRAFDGATYFERLLTRFSTPEELFGPLSLKALEDDRYERLTDGYLPTASVGFLDEVFKANSAILNALLTLLNEREFDNGAGRSRTPLISVVGATNEVPADESLMAFYDRFLLRVPVAPVSDAAFESLLTMTKQQPPAAEPIRRDELDALLHARDALPLAPSLVTQMRALREVAAQSGLAVSDRRWRQLVGLMRSAALTEGRAEVDAWDLWLAPYALATEPAQVPTLDAWFIEHVAQAQPIEAPWLTRAVEALERQLELESTAQADASDDAGAGKLALAKSIGGAQDGDMQRLMSAGLEAHLRKRYGALHIAARVEQVDEVMAHAEQHLAPLQAQADATTEALAGRLWLSPALATRLQATQAANISRLGGLIERLRSARLGYAALPLAEPASAGARPEPVSLPG